MAILWADGFDRYPASTPGDFISLGGWTAYAAAPPTTTSVTTPYGAGRALSNNNGWLEKTLGFNTSNTVYVNFAGAVPHSLDGSSSTRYYYVQFYDGATAQVHVGVYGDGAIRVHRGTGSGNLLATFTSAHVGGTVWHHWQIKIVFATGTAGEVRIRKNGDTSDTFSATSLNTSATGNAYANVVRVANSGSLSYGGLVDDFVLNDSSGSTNTSWLGETRIRTRYASGAGSSTTFSTNSTSNWFANSEAGVNDGDTTYSYSSNVNDVDLYAMGDLGVIPDSIYGVKLSVITKKSDAGARGAGYVLKSGSTTDTGSDTLLSTSYGRLGALYETDPDTSAAWTQSGVDAVEAGIKVTS